VIKIEDGTGVRREIRYVLVDVVLRQGALAPDVCSLDGRAVLQDRQKREHRALRKLSVLEKSACLARVDQTGLKLRMLFPVDASGFLGIGGALVDWRVIKFLCHLSFP
jgi:hypothetical protein